MLDYSTTSQQFKGAPYFNLSLDQDTVLEGSDIPPAVPPFLACGDLSGWDESEQVMMDADKSYPIRQDFVSPIAPPILPPHQAQQVEKANVSFVAFACISTRQPHCIGGRVILPMDALFVMCPANIKDFILPLINRNFHS